MTSWFLADWHGFPLDRIIQSSNGNELYKTVLDDIAFIIFVAICIYAILHLWRGKDAGLPFLSKMSGGDLTAAFSQKAKAQAAPAGYAPPQSVAPVNAPPVQSPAPEQTPPAQTAAAVRLRSFCGASVSGDSAFCTECGAKTE